MANSLKVYSKPKLLKSFSLKENDLHKYLSAPQHQGICSRAVSVILWSPERQRRPFSLGENGFSTLSSVYTITETALAAEGMLPPQAWAGAEADLSTKLVVPLTLRLFEISEGRFR